MNEENNEFLSLRDQILRDLRKNTIGPFLLGSDYSAFDINMFRLLSMKPIIRLDKEEKDELLS